MKPSTLRNKFESDDDEIRLAAARAGGLKEDPCLIPDLIVLLGDSEPAVAQAARRALKSLTGRDFGPAPDADDPERLAAVAGWHAWWKAHPAATAAAK